MKAAKTLFWSWVRKCGYENVLARLLGAALVLFLGATSAQAGPIVNATFQSVSPGEGVTFSLQGAGISNEGTIAGAFNWTANSGGISGNFTTFCIELNQYISYGGTYTYDIVPLAQAGNPDSGIFGPGTTGPLGTIRADLLSELFAKHYSQVVDNQTAAAFQLDVWKIVYDGSRAPGALNLSTGNFTATANPGTETLAQNWLDSLDGSGSRASLLGLTSPTAQDQVTLNLVPEPSTLVLCGIAGSVLWPMLRRRRT